MKKKERLRNISFIVKAALFDLEIEGQTEKFQMLISLLDKMLGMEKILLEDIPNKDKIISASEYLSGLEFNKLSKSLARKVEEEFSQLNSILKQYPIKTFDDYRQISTEHLSQMVEILNRICQRLKKFSRTNYAIIRGI